MAASYFTGPLWHRRIRVLGLSTVLVLYSGQPSDLYRMLAVAVGLGVGWLFRPILRLTSWRRSSDHETRTLLAAIVGMVAVGPIITIFSGARFGLLAPVGLLLTQDVPSAGDVLDWCRLGDATRQCVQELSLERIGGIGPGLVSLLPLLTLIVAVFGLARGRRFAAWLAITVNSGLALLAAWYYGLLPISGQAYVWQWQSGRYWEVTLILVVPVLVPLAVAFVIFGHLRRFPVPSRSGQLPPRQQGPGRAESPIDCWTFSVALLNRSTGFGPCCCSNANFSRNSPRSSWPSPTLSPCRRSDLRWPGPTCQASRCATS